MRTRISRCFAPTCAPPQCTFRTPSICPIPFSASRRLTIRSRSGNEYVPPQRGRCFPDIMQGAMC